MNKIKKELEKFLSFLPMTLGGIESDINLKKLNSELYHLQITFQLDKDVTQDNWQINFKPKFTPNFNWAPHLTPEENDIIDQHAFRAPVVIVSDDENYLAILPDLNMMPKKDIPERRYLDMNAETNTITFGASCYQVRDHVLFERKKGAKYAKGVVEFGLFIMVSNDKNDIFNPWRKPMSFLWEKHGSAMFAKKEPIGQTDLTPFVEHTYNWAFNSWKDAVWQEMEIDGETVGAPAFIVNFSQSPNYTGEKTERERMSIWNQAWFSSLRSASGLYRYAKKTNNKELLKKANMSKELALKAPIKNGIFPAVRTCEATVFEDEFGEWCSISEGWETAYWGNSDRNPNFDIKTAPYHILDMSFTALLMLRWYDELEKDKNLLAYATEHGNALLRLQDEDGFFPAWLDIDDLHVWNDLKQSPESSMCVTFLLKLYDVTGEEKYKTSALKCMDALLIEIVPNGRWEDFETYWSCSKWGIKDWVGKKIPRNNMYKQCNFSIFWTAEALLESYKATKDSKYLKWGQRTLDELITHQAVWQPPYMYVNVFGGFSVMNCDGEWIDARQSLFAEIVLEYGQILNKKEYTERGLSAMRASFAMMYCPELPKPKEQWETTYPFFNEKDYGFTMENYGHGGYTNKEGKGVGVFTIYDWGNGAASEAWNRLTDHYGKDFLL